MKKLFLVAATLLSANVFALSSDFKFVPANDSQPTNLCVIAAQDGIAAAKRVARQAGIFSDIAFNMTECNGQNIRRFAAQFKQTPAELETKTEESTQIDYEFKVKNAKKFIAKGDKVKFTIRFKGRELQHSHLGNELMSKIKEDMKEIGKVELHPKFDGKQMIMVIQPL